VAVEDHPKQVEHLALVPVGAREELGHRAHAVVSLGLDPEPSVLGHRVEQVLKLEAGLGLWLVHCRQVDPADVPQLVAGALYRLDDVLGSDHDVRDTVRRSAVIGVREGGAEPFKNALGSDRHR
jgi:hypothetical protein